jgi:hypothetical protein
MFWAEGDPIRVELNTDGLPRQFTWHGRWHPVECIANRWRVDEGWWVQHTWRDYFKLTTSTGLLLTIYQDLLTGHWYVQRVSD